MIKDEKHIITKIFSLRNKGYSLGKIYKRIRSYYENSFSRSKIKELLNKENIEFGYKYRGYKKRIILSLYKKFYDTEKVVEYLNDRFNINITKAALIQLAHKNNVKKEHYNQYKQSKVTRKEEKEIVRLYAEEKLSTRKIADKFGYKTRKSITDKLKKHNMNIKDKNETKKRNTGYYDFSLKKIDNKFKAYFLGLLLTDGYLIKKDKGIGISLTDKECIKFLSDNIGAGIYKVGKEDCKDKYRIALYGKRYVKQTKRYGMVLNKSLKIPKPKLNKEEEKYITYIIRGIIDGDGWIQKDGKEFFISSASEKFIIWVKEKLINLGMKNINIKFVDNQYNGIYIIRSHRKYNMNILKYKIYDKPFGMSRKYKRLNKKKSSETVIGSSRENENMVQSRLQFA